VGGAGDPVGGEALSVPAMGDHGGKADFAGEDGGGCGEAVVGCPSLDPVPEAFQACEDLGVRGWIGVLPVQ